ncbi:MAG: hypothetical protein QOE93_562 [Actinomycetota bacterium]|nr:hypothetical protein [Actinomycetota bacterium]
MVAGAIIRIGTDRTRPPGVYQDSEIYMKLAEHAPWAPYSPSRPSGYPVVLRFIDAMVAGLDAVTFVQHVAGLVLATLLYILLLRLGVRRWLAVAAVAVIALDSYTVALEQDVLAETLFTLTLFGSLLLAVRAEERPARMAGSGFLLAFAVTMRTVGLFVVPVWIGWLLWTRCSRRALLAGVVALAVPIVGYASLHAAEGVGFNLVDSDGWYLYAKVGPIVDCRGASVPAETRALCVEPPTDDPNFYLYNPGSPAWQLFFGNNPVELEVDMTHERNVALRRFSRAIILANPFEYGVVVTRDFVKYFGPAPAPVELSLYGMPGGLVIHYERWLHVRWWMVTGALAGGLAAVAVAGARHRRSAALFLGAALALVLGAAATAAFNIRYVVPVMPFLLAAGVPGIDERLDRLATALWRRRPAPDLPGDDAHLVADPVGDVVDG